MLFLLAFLPSLLFAQRQYLEATITTNDGLKIDGKVAAESWAKTPSSIDFTINNGNEKTYSIADLSGFTVTRKDGGKLFFERKEVEIEISSHILSELEITPVLHYQNETAWLQLIYQGRWKLYTFTSKSGKQHFFVESDGGNPKELVRKQWKNDYKIESVDLYRKQLLELAQDCAPVQKMLLSKKWAPRQGEGLNEKDLLSFCKEIDNCAGTKPTYVLTREKSKLTGLILAGAHYSTYQFSPYSSREINGFSGGQIGVGLNYFFRKSNNRIALYNEVMFYNDKITDTDTDIGSLKLVSIIEYRSSQIALNNMVTFKLTKLPITPCLKVGLSNRFGINWEITERKGLPSEVDNITPIDRNSFKEMNHEIGPTIGICGQFKRIGLDVRMANTYLTGSFGLSKKPSSKLFAMSLTYQIF